jgi:hypothetical protein
MRIYSTSAIPSLPNDGLKNPILQLSTLEDRLSSKQVHEGERQRTQARCPKCPRLMKVQEHVGRTVETIGGPVALDRPYFYYT